MSLPSRCDACTGSWYTLAHTAPISAYTFGTLACFAGFPSPAVPAFPGEPPGAKWRADHPTFRKLFTNELVPSCVSSHESPGYGPMVSPWGESELVNPPVYPE